MHRMRFIWVSLYDNFFFGWFGSLIENWFDWRNKLSWSSYCLDHFSLHFHSIVKLKPKLAPPVSWFFRIEIQDFVLHRYFLLKLRSSFLDTKHKVVLHYYRWPEASWSDIIFANFYDTVVAWVAEFLVLANHRKILGRNIENSIWYFKLIFVLEPWMIIRQNLWLLRPLSP